LELVVLVVLQAPMVLQVLQPLSHMHQQLLLLLQVVVDMVQMEPSINTTYLVTVEAMALTTVAEITGMAELAELALVVKV
jgi:hypothetical protein